MMESLGSCGFNPEYTCIIVIIDVNVIPTHVEMFDTHVCDDMKEA